MLGVTPPHTHTPKKKNLSDAYVFSMSIFTILDVVSSTSFVSAIKSFFFKKTY